MWAGNDSVTCMWRLIDTLPYPTNSYLQLRRAAAGTAPAPANSIFYASRKLFLQQRKIQTFLVIKYQSAFPFLKRQCFPKPCAFGELLSNSEKQNHIQYLNERRVLFHHQKHLVGIDTFGIVLKAQILCSGINPELRTHRP